MDPWFVIALLLALGLVVVAVVATRAVRTTRRVGAIVETSGIAPSDRDGIAAGASRLRAERDELRRSLEVERGDAAVLAETVEAGILAVGPDLHIRSANATAHALLGRPIGSLVGRSVMEAFLDPDAEAVVRAASSAGAAAGELRPAGLDGTALALRARPMTDGAGTWLVIEDVTELRRLQRIRTEFIDNLSHELRTPLTTVSLLAETLSRDAAGAGEGVSPRMRDRIAKIEIETGHLVQMVNELLDLSRIEGGGTLQPVDGVDVGTLAADSAERLRLFADRQGVALSTEIEPDLPLVRGDPSRLGQVVVNLVHNAVKFSPDGGDVVVRAARVPGEVVVSVEDHGVGIPKAAQDRIFERFYKVDRARMRAETGGGTGLGLAIARHVVEQHGGRIWVVSREGRGSTFSFALPVATGGSAPASAAPASAASVSAPEPGS